MPNLLWNGPSTIQSRTYTCGNCGTYISSNQGYSAYLPGSPMQYEDAAIAICHRCAFPTFLGVNGEQVPGARYGNDVAHITDEKIEQLYQEARDATGSGSYTLAVLACRKLLMHIAVSKGAKKGESFAQYVDYLSENNFVPPGAKPWVDHIRKKGNQANHEIVLMEREEAEDLITFIHMLLTVIFELPGTMQSRYPSTD